MSSNSNDEDERAQPQNLTKKKGHRPCDMCRKKKRRCDGGDPCNRCVEHEYQCTYQQRAMPRLASSNYVNSLETRLKAVESLLQESKAAAAKPTPEASTSAAGIDDLQAQGIALMTRAIRQLNAPFPAPFSDDLSFIDVPDSLTALSLDDSSIYGFQGKSSQAMLVRAAVEIRNQSVPGASSSRASDNPPIPKTWSSTPWTAPPTTYTFPPQDLLLRLISAYFTSVNPFIPILHRPTFEKDFAAHKHLSPTDDGFAKIVLLVCALGARYSDDPRVNANGMPIEMLGYEWFDQVKLTTCSEPGLYDLQRHCLLLQIFDRTSGSRAAWTLAGFGIRAAQDIGAHRLKIRRKRISPEEELEKRAYWALIIYDIQLSVCLGRAVAIQGYDFDLDLPTIVDDEYWFPTANTDSFCQPSDKPSSVDFFVCLIRLNRILSLELKVLYSTNMSRTIIAIKDESVETFVCEFDSALDLWLDSVPEHLRWTSDRPTTNNIFFDQSAALYCNYYMTQILIHRPFIHRLRPSLTPSFPSLNVCNNAARACARVAEVHHRRRPAHPLIFAQSAIFTAGIVLLLNIWGTIRNGSIQDDSEDVADVRRCIEALKGYHRFWPSARVLSETLEQLLNADHPPPSPGRHAAASSEHLNGNHNRTSTPIELPPPLALPSDLNVKNDFDGVPTWSPVPLMSLNDIDLEMSTHDYGPGEAPARPPITSSSVSQFDFSSTSTLAGGILPYAMPDSEQFGNNPDTVALWSSAPSGFQVSDWDSFLGSIGS
ncbi:Zn(2)-C6 fungal-type domain-containing protein [Favolaschia claudopus]|uniref:Zn(2)-C6 fungal-type domain-containing protein n=1 Tax=Favolaschia claudopus TaxID=2862362 RepID=A0AAW0CBL6_9AGAR